MTVADERREAFAERTHIDWLLPAFYAAVAQSPIFRWGLRRLRWLRRRPEPLRSYRDRVRAIVSLLAVGLIFFIAMDRRGTPYGFAGDSLLIAGLILMSGALVLMTLSDFLPVRSAGYFYRRDLIHADLLRVTPLSLREIVAAYHGLVVFDSWRVMLAFRMFWVVGAVVLGGGILLNFLDSYRRYTPTQLSYWVDVISFIASYMLCSGIVAWMMHHRVRAMSALSLLLVVGLRHEWLRLFVNILLVVIHWLILLVIPSAVLFFSISVSLQSGGYGYTTAYLYLIFFALPPALYFIFRVLYGTIETRSLKHAEWRLSHNQSEA